MRILLVEDHVELRAASVQTARTYLNAAAYDVAILDRMLPDGDSIELLHALRSADNRTPCRTSSA